MDHRVDLGGAVKVVADVRDETVEIRRSAPGAVTVDQRAVGENEFRHHATARLWSTGSSPAPNSKNSTAMRTETPLATCSVMIALRRSATSPAISTPGSWVGMHDQASERADQPEPRSIRIPGGIHAVSEPSLALDARAACEAGSRCRDHR